MKTSTFAGYAAFKIVQKFYSCSTSPNEKAVDQTRIWHDQCLFGEAPQDEKELKQWLKEKEWLEELGRELMGSKQLIETYKQVSKLKLSKCPFEGGLEVWWEDMDKKAATAVATPKRKLQLKLIILPGVDYEDVRTLIKIKQVKNLSDITKKGAGTTAINCFIQHNTKSSIDAEAIENWLREAQAVVQVHLGGKDTRFSDVKLQCGGSLSRSRFACSVADIFVFDQSWNADKIRAWIFVMQKQELIVDLFSYDKNEWKLGKENEVFEPEISCPWIFEGTSFCQAAISVEGNVYMANIAFVEEKSRSSMMLHSHSSPTFMRALFQVGLQHDLVLHPTGVYSFEEWKKGGVPREIRREEEIFALIGVDWHPPSTRTADFDEDHLSWSGRNALGQTE